MELRPLLHLSVEAIEKGAFGSPSTMVANFTFYLPVYKIYCHMPIGSSDQIPDEG